MIPIKLTVRNFMPYQDNVPPLDFTGIHTACISGENGSGKSALIDAITWALWGKARAKSDDDLVHQGRMEMAVEFDFTINQQQFRIIRKRSRPKRRTSPGQTILEFQMATNDGFKTISGDSIAQTRLKIIDTLHMDYNTFVSSALLLQGHADEFTNQPPTKRKEVLANILGLSLYDELGEKAKNLSRQQEMEKAQLESTIQDITEELSQKSFLRAELERLQIELARLDNIVSEQETNLKNKRQAKEALEYKKQQLTELQQHVTASTRDLDRWSDLAEQHQKRVRDYEEVIAQNDTIEEGYANFTKAKKSKNELDQKLLLVNKLNEHKYGLDKAIELSRQDSLNKHARALDDVTRLEKVSQKLPDIKGELQRLRAQLQHPAQEEETLQGKRQHGQEIQTKVNRLEVDKNRLTQEITELTEKLDLLSTWTEAKCPLCETELGKEGLGLIGAKYQTEIKQKSNTLQANQSELTQTQTELLSLDNGISRLENRIKQDRAAMQSKEGILNQQVNDAEAARQQLDEKRKNLPEIEQGLAQNTFALQEQEALKKLDAELARLDYNTQQHEQVRQQLLHLEHYETQKRKLEEADKHISKDRETASRAEQALEEGRSSLEADKQRSTALFVELNKLPQITDGLAHAESEHRALINQQKQTQEAMWGVKAKFDRAAELETKKQEKGEALRQALREENIYRDLAQAFGKKGIQAMLIETAIPEIENEANRLLGRMTDNRMHVKIETQRETKKGDTVETMDITIADELGTRSYEMFSGGEAFRINFAVRIALSKLLARRAGAPLPTLIIDEGFGTQDSSGIEKLKEAINSIQEDFDKILVITHVEELRDAFPTRIDVVKSADGSTISIG